MQKKLRPGKNRRSFEVAVRETLSAHAAALATLAKNDAGGAAVRQITHEPQENAS